MIETQSAKNGSAVVREDGRWLASAFDPEAEARAWLARRRTFLDKIQAVFVLGAGAGYHIAELVKHTEARVVVIEPKYEIIEAVRRIHAFDSTQVKFECIEDARQLRASAVVKAAIAVSFVVLQYPPSLASAPNVFRDCEAQLIGRDWGTLRWQWALKGFAPLDSQVQILKADKPLTILDLEQTELVQNSEERERMLIKALRELIK